MIENNAPYERRFSKNLFFIKKEVFTKLMRTGTSTRGPITVAKACGESMPKTEIATAMASSKLLDAAVKLKVTAC